MKRIDIGKEAAIEAEVKAARERAIVPLEIRMKQFRDLLAEKGVRLLRPFPPIIMSVVIISIIAMMGGIVDYIILLGKSPCKAYLLICLIQIFII